MVLLSAARACSHMGTHARSGALTTPAPARWVLISQTPVVNIIVITVIIVIVNRNSNNSKISNTKNK